MSDQTSQPIPASQEQADAPAFLRDGGVTGALVRSLDWSRTPLGPIAGWPASLKTTVGTLLHSRHPMFLWWGTELVQIYNDGYLPSFGVGKHPAAMGQRGADCWQEIWPAIAPQIEAVMRQGQASWHEDQLLPIARNGRLEEVFWTYGYSPVFDESGAVGGTLVVCTETTRRVLGERRLRALRAVAVQTALGTDSAEVIDRFAEVIEGDTARHDTPFALLYGAAAPGRAPELLRAVGIDRAASALLDRTFGDRLETLERSAETTAVPADFSLAGGPWPEPTTELFVAPIPDGTQRARAGYLLLGISPRLTFDDGYRDYLRHLGEALGQTLARIESFRQQVTARQVMERAHREREKLLGELEAALRAKDEFLAMLGHELRNPLAPIVTALHLIRLRGAGALTNEQVVIERQVKHLVRLVDDLLDVSQHQLAIDVAEHGLSLEGDPVRLAQVFANLLTNAARYTEPGGAVVIQARRVAEEIVIRVRDNGAGIAPELLPRIFDLFVQGKRSADRAEGGLGLGLALVRNLVTLHGGQVEARSEGLGRGSEFVVSLPAAAPVTAITPPPIAPQPSSATLPRRVLVVDDNTDAAEMLGQMLSADGHQVAIAHDPIDALRRFDEFHPEVAVLDIGLPVMDGYELGARMRERDATAACRLVAVTGYGQEHDRARSRAAGFAHHLVKPIDLRQLLLIVDGSD